MGKRKRVVKKIMIHCVECKKSNLYTYLHINPTTIHEELKEAGWKSRLHWQTAPDRHPFLDYTCSMHGD